MTAYFKKALKTFTAIALCLTCVFSGSFVNASVAEITDTGVEMRDPFVLKYEDKYYMYGTEVGEEGFYCVYGNDLKNWSEPVRIVEPSDVSDGEDDWWAPECHYYKGAFYLFASYLSSESGKRGVAIFRSPEPLGPFENITGGHITPKDSDSIDGTLYVDESGQPWMIYVAEWTSAEDGIGGMMAVKLSDDLTSFKSEPVMLFKATDGLQRGGILTDGPFLYKTKNGRLIMLWSNIDNGGYCVRIAFSTNGRVDGKWLQQPGYLYQKNNQRADGGHGMLFTAPDGALMLAIHSPNFPTEEKPITAVFVPVTDTGYTLIMDEEDSLFLRLGYRLFYSLMDFIYLFDSLKHLTIC